MILIFSQSAMEPTTEEVMDWLEALGTRCLRLNGEDLDGGMLSFRLDGEDVTLRVAGGGAAAGPVALPLGEIGAVWFRRWVHERRHEMVSLLDEPSATDHKLHHDLRRHLTLESRKLSDFLFSRLAGRPWLSHPKRASLNKLDVLTRAAQAGFATPATLVTTERDELRRFCLTCGGPQATVITKPIGEVDMFVAGERSHFIFTSSLDLAAIDALPERFAPSLFQERVEKTYELRVFYLTGELYAMAIFSQLDAQTQTDFRRYNRERPNRTVPFRLPAETAERLRLLMDDLGLETGSADLLQARDGRIVFLEINPVGQLGMVSKPCNYHLERKLAETLIRKELDGRRA
jgi:ATP-GRASP peptide maturase of grasp-with-spasm system